MSIAVTATSGNLGRLVKDLLNRGVTVDLARLIGRPATLLVEGLRPLVWRRRDTRHRHTSLSLSNPVQRPPGG